MQVNGPLKLVPHSTAQHSESGGMANLDTLSCGGQKCTNNWMVLHRHFPHFLCIPCLSQNHTHRQNTHAHNFLKAEELMVNCSQNYNIVPSTLLSILGTHTRLLLPGFEISKHCFSFTKYYLLPKFWVYTFLFTVKFSSVHIF